jgi:putative hydrolase of the HAD superfamily
MSDVRCVLFDLDETLYPERRFLLSGCRAVAVALESVRGVPRRESFAFMQHWIRRHGRERVLQALCRHYVLPRTWVEDMVDIIRRHSPDICLPAASVQVLESLRAAGLRLGIVTNGVPDVQRRKVAALRVAPLVDGVIYAEDHAPGGKPHPAVFARALLRLQVSAAATVFVGDHPVKDVGGAAAAGLQTVWLTRRPLRDAVAADAVVEHIAAVPEAVFLRLERLRAHAS